jgi:hypothetical protein
VAHLPWNVLGFRFFNTVIDDVFSVFVRMPLMHRISVFRDDIIFVIYIFQRWIYPVDASRPAEGFDTEGGESTIPAVSRETAEEEVWLADATGKFQRERIQVNPGFFKLVDELFVNAHDHVVRLRQRKSETPVKHIDITCDGTFLSVDNDGDPIDVAEHPEHKVWIPQLIFGELLTSTNYDKEEKKLVGGKNGYESSSSTSSPRSWRSPSWTPIASSTTSRPSRTT